MLLDSITNPHKIKQLNQSQLIQLSNELREFVMNTILENGGHFAANLGVIELTVSLLHHFDLQRDKFIWDVGHQSYPYKVLTGRKDQLASIRTMGGISGFPKVDESEFDHFGTGHSSTSISAAMGMATANKLNGSDAHVVAIIGDGALTGGMSYEALNNIMDSQLNLTIILNDNQMGIDPNTGALNTHLMSKDFDGIKQWVQWFGLEYYGPVDGHNIEDLLTILNESKTSKKPVLIHTITTKGKGYEPAEREQTKYHSTNKYVKIDANQKPTEKWQDVFGEMLLYLAEKFNHVVGITPAMPSSCGMDKAMKIYPERFYDVGISEQHAVTFAAGLAASGKIPFVNIYSSFLQRAYDQIIHDVALQNLPVVFCIDRAGLVGEDGPTHHGAYDIAFLNCIPNIKQFAPRNATELFQVLIFAINYNGPISVRYPKGPVSENKWKHANLELQEYTWLLNGEISNTLIISTGHASNIAEEALKDYKNLDHLHCLAINPESIPPLDQYKTIITIEDGCIDGGFGQSLKNKINSNASEWIHLGIPKKFIQHGSNALLYEECGYGVNSIRSLIDKTLKSN